MAKVINHFLPKPPILGTKEITENGTYDASTDGLDGYSQVTVDVEGGGAVPTTGEYRVRFFDYDGTYEDVWVNEGEDATPPNFDHSIATDFAPALTFQGWNKPYTNITEDTEIGAVYIPTDGKTHFYLQITGGTGKDITLYASNSGGNIVIKWGDGRTFSSTATTITAEHTFAEYGVYHCTIENTLFGDFQLGRGSISTAFCGGSSQQMRDALIAIYLGDKVQLSSRSFYYNYALKYTTIPNSVTSMGSEAFYSCSSLTSITIPSSITSMGVGAFRHCYSLTNFIIPDSVTSIGSYAFNQCHSLTNISIPSDVTSIGSYAFNKCHSLTNISIPSDVTSIGNYAFNQCYSLTNITIPSGVTSIGDYAFNQCYSLKKVLIEGDTVKTLADSNAFGNIPKSTMFFVKDELVEDYKDETNWTTYAAQIMPMSEEANYYG